MNKIKMNKINEKTNRIIFTSMISVQAAAISFATDLFSCDIRESLENTRGLGSEEAD